MTDSPRDVLVAVGTTSVEISPEQFAPAVRKIINIANTSTGGQVITIVQSGEASLLAGVPLYPGGYWNESQSDANERITQNRWTAISSLAGGQLSIHEVVRTGGN